jgi:hypothetical protein
MRITHCHAEWRDAIIAMRRANHAIAVMRAGRDARRSG